jgi:serine/threonine protein kinase
MESKDGGGTSRSRDGDAKDAKRGGSSGENKISGSGLSMRQTRYGPYEITKAIGKGKFAIVYRAKRMDDDLVVALKRIRWRMLSILSHTCLTHFL